MTSGKTAYQGAALAVLATLIWSGNFIVARAVAGSIPPITLAFLRWSTATILIMPFARKYVKAERYFLKKNIGALTFTALLGVTLFNTLIYIAGHYSEAINLALIGTTSSPIMSVFLAAIFLKEPISKVKLSGMLLCIAGILLLLSKGSAETLLRFRFGTGDWWILGAALAFAGYNIMVRKRDHRISSTHFLFIVFALGTALLLPAMLIEQHYSQVELQWNLQWLLIIFYLGAGTSVVSFLCWNAAIAKLGAGRTALFGNLIPVFSAIEAIVILHERFTVLHVMSSMLVVAGLLVANSQSK